MMLRTYLIGTLISLPIFAFAECDARILPTDLVADVQHKLSCFAAENAELKKKLQAQTPERPARPRFADGQWRYFKEEKGGVEVARRLTQIGPPQDSVVVAYDGYPKNNTFHVWYRGQGTSTRYTYAWGKPSDLTDPPLTNYFLSEPGIIPAGIGGEGSASTPIPIYFVATQ